MALLSPRSSSHRWLTARKSWMTQPLCLASLSRSITATTGCSAPVPSIGTFNLARSSRLGLYLRISTTGSHVPHKSPIRVHATSMPHAMRPGHRFTAALLSWQPIFPDFDIVYTAFSTRHRWFAYARLLVPYLTKSRSAFSINAHHQGS
jgi:hypothetical protein